MWETAFEASRQDSREDSEDSGALCMGLGRQTVYIPYIVYPFRERLVFFFALDGQSTKPRDPGSTAG